MGKGDPMNCHTCEKEFEHGEPRYWFRSKCYCMECFSKYIHKKPSQK